MARRGRGGKAPPQRQPARGLGEVCATRRAAGIAVGTTYSLSPCGRRLGEGLSSTGWAEGSHTKILRHNSLNPLSLQPRPNRESANITPNPAGASLAERPAAG